MRRVVKCCFLAAVCLASVSLTALAAVGWVRSYWRQDDVYLAYLGTRESPQPIGNLLMLASRSCMGSIRISVSVASEPVPRDERRRAADNTPPYWIDTLGITQERAPTLRRNVLGIWLGRLGFQYAASSSRTINVGYVSHEFIVPYWFVCILAVSPSTCMAYRVLVLRRGSERGFPLKVVSPEAEK
jgi:hypothetical protein